jgi:hypothetical protein
MIVRIISRIYGRGIVTGSVTGVGVVAGSRIGGIADAIATIGAEGCLIGDTTATVRTVLHSVFLLNMFSDKLPVQAEIFSV